MRAFRRGLALVALLLAACSAVGILRHSQAVVRVHVAPLEGAPEVGDGVGGTPDWRLDLLLDDKWEKLGVFRDTPLGEGLSWDLPQPAARRLLAAVRLVEDDATKDDVLEERPVEGLEFVGRSYRYVLETERDLQAGLGWFFQTPQGMLVALALFISLLAATLRFDIT